MIVDELYGLALWLESEVVPILPLYDNLASTLEHNAQNAQKVPVKDNLEKLERALQRMRIQSLTAEQDELLSLNGASEYLGLDGLQYFRKLVRDGRFDPQTAAQGARNAYSVVSEAQRKLTVLKEALQAGNVPVAKPFSEETGVITRLHFKEKASIGDVHELKRWSSEWYEPRRVCRRLIFVSYAAKVSLSRAA